MIEAVEQNEGHRINHPAFRDIYNVTYAKGVITEFEVEDTAETLVVESVFAGTGVFPFITWEFTDRVKLDISGDEWIPLFYHCKLHCYDEDIVSLRGNKALKGSAYAFEIDDEVTVLLEEGVPKYVIGLFEVDDENGPRMCAQYFKLSIGNHVIYSNHRTKEDSINTIPIDHYGDEPNCDQCGSISNWNYKETDETHYPSEPHDHYWYYFDYLVKVGPVLYIFLIFGKRVVHYPGYLYESGTPVELRVFSGVWSEELEAKCRAAQLPANKFFDAGEGYYSYDEPMQNRFPGLSSLYPSEMKEQIYYSAYNSDRYPTPVFGMFFAYGGLETWIDIPWYIHELLYFDKMKIEGQSYYKKEE